VGGSLGGTDTGLTVAGGLVGDGELTQVATDHVEFDFDVVEALSVVDGDVVADHLGHHDGISQMGLDGGGLLSGLSILFGFLAFSLESDVFMLDFFIKPEVLLVKRLRILALKSSTTCSRVSSLSWSGVSPL
jgi:hypothetical protein